MCRPRLFGSSWIVLLGLGAVLAGLTSCADNQDECRDRTRPAGQSGVLTPLAPPSLPYLEARSPDDSSVVLSWFAPIDYCFNEPATRFEIRYADTYETLAGWEGATVFADSVPALDPDRREFLGVGGLEPGRTYFFAYRVSYLSAGNTQLSRIVQATTTACGAAFPAAGFDFVRRFVPSPADPTLIDVDADSAGNIYVLNLSERLVQVYSSAGAFLRQWGGVGEDPGQFLLPSRISVGGDGRIYVSETTARVQRFSPQGGFLGQVAGAVDRSLWIYFQRQNLAIDASGNVYIANRDLGRVRKVDPAGHLVLTWGDDTADPLPGKFDPTGIAVGADGDIYVSTGDISTSGPHAISRFTPAGSLVDTWNTDSFCPAPASSSRLRPGPDGTFFLLDPWSARVFHISPAGTVLHVFGRLGSDEGRLWNPFSLGVAASGRVVLLDAREDDDTPAFDVVVFEPGPGS